MTNYVIVPPLRIPYATHQYKIGRAIGLFPEQIIGLVPCQLKNFIDCRNELSQCIDVYAKVGGNDREIDMNSFLFQFPLSTGSNNAFYLQKKTAGVWNDLTVLNANTYGTFYNFNSLLPYGNYSGFKIDWSLVLGAFGEGTYRFIVKDLIFFNADNNLISYPFVLHSFDCNSINMTIKFESTYKGSVTNFYKETYNSRIALFDLVDLAGGWYDSMRYEGSLGRKQYINENTTEARLNSNENKLLYSKVIDTYNVTLAGYNEELLTRLHLYGCNGMDIFITDYSTQAKFYYEKKGLIFVNAEQPNYLANTQKAWRFGAMFKDKTEKIHSKAGFLN